MVATNYDIIQFCDRNPELIKKLNQSFQEYLDVLNKYSNQVHRGKVDEAKKKLFSSDEMHTLDKKIREDFNYSPNQHIRDIFRRLIRIYRKHLKTVEH